MRRLSKLEQRQLTLVINNMEFRKKKAILTRV